MRRLIPTLGNPVRQSLLRAACLLSSALVAPATLPAQPQDSTATLAPFLDDATLAVVSIEVGQNAVLWQPVIDAAQVADPVTSAWMTVAFGKLESSTESLRDAGVTQFHAVISLHDVARRMPYLVVPAAGAEQAERVAEFFRERGFEVSAAQGNVVVCGNSGLLERLQPQRVPPRSAALGEALAAAADAPVRLVCVPTADQHRVLQEMLPRLPESWGGLSGSEISAGLTWLSAAFDPQTQRLQLTIQSRDHDAAAKLAGALPKLLVSRLQTVAEASLVRRFEVMLKAAPPSVGGAKITLSLGDDDKTRRELTQSLVFLAGRLATGSHQRNLTHNLKQLGLAFHNFHDKYGSFPPPTGYDANDKPLLSWRVHLLPFLEEHELYREFHLDEPWDSPHNRLLINRMPDVFKSQHFDLNLAGKTVLQLPVGESTGFHGKAGVPIKEFADGTSNTVMILEVPREQAVPWTKPQDFAIDNRPIKPRLIVDKDGAWSAFCDGSAQLLTPDLTEETLRALVTHQGGEVVSR